MSEVWRNAENINGDSENEQTDAISGKLGESQPKGHVFSIPLDQVVPDEEQPRKRWTHIERLKEAIRIGGQIQPITVVPDGNGKYKIKDGESRWRAMKELAGERGEDASQSTIDVLIRHESFDTNTGFLINVVREGYTPIEIARALRKLLDSKAGMTQQQVASMVGKSLTNINEYLSLLRLPRDVQEDALASNIVPFNKLKQLAARGEMSDKKKTKFYRQLKKEYEEKKYGEDSEAEKTRPAQMQSGAEENLDERIAIQRKKYNVMAKRLDATSSALMKFRPENISTPEEKESLNAKLDMIITNAQGMKARINQE